MILSIRLVLAKYLTFFTHVSKKCPKCGSWHSKKDGREGGKQRYRCLKCRKRFTPKNLNWINKACKNYAHGKQTLAQLTQKYRLSTRTIQAYLDRHQPVTGEICVSSYPVIVTMDATFFGRGHGLLLARAESKNLFWRWVKGETLAEYEALLGDLEFSGCQISGFIIDGRKGVRELLLKRFPQIPLQLCQFHQLAIVRRYLTNKPKLVAGQQLLKIAKDLKKCGYPRFTRKLKKWQKRWEIFLEERVWDNSKRGWHYKHKRLRSAYRSLMTNSPWLFTWLYKFKSRKFSTTNSCDGYFRGFKEKLGIHHGLSRKRHKKMADYFLEDGCF